MLRCAVAGLAALIVATAASAARADDVELPWQAPPGCPTAAEFLGYVADELEVPRGADELGLWATVDVRPDDGGEVWRARIFDDAGAQRTIQAGTCDELARATALVVAMANREQTPAVAPPVRIAAAPAPVVVETAPPPPPSPAADPSGLWVRGVTTLDLGTFNGVAPAWGVGAELAGRRWALDLAFTRISTWTSDRPGLQPAANGVTVRGCRLWASETAARRIDLCTGFEGTQLQASGYLGAAATERAPALFGQLGAAGSWRLAGPVRLRLDAALGYLIVRPSFTMDSFAAPSPFIARVGVSLELRAR